MTSKKGTLVIISAPSGGGKTTVIRKLMARIPYSGKVVTTTTRPLRPREKDGVDYYFIPQDTFQNRVARGEFVEHVKYAGHQYGLEKAELARKLAVHPVVFAPLEIQGEKRLEELGIPHIAIFLLPESIDALKKHIRDRGARMSDKVLYERLAIAEEELRSAEGYDYRIYNKEGKLGQTVEEVMRILDPASREKRGLTKKGS